MAKLLVEIYVDDFLWNSTFTHPFLVDYENQPSMRFSLWQQLLTKQKPDTGPLFASNYNGDFTKLEHLIDVLFCFAFTFHSSLFIKKAYLELFCDSVQTWLQKLVFKFYHFALFFTAVSIALYSNHHTYVYLIIIKVGIYLYVASPRDHVRLLHHVLNCPGIGTWGSHFIHFSENWYIKK